MIKKTFFYSVCLILGGWCSSVQAGEQIFKINNALSQTDVEGVTDEYIDIFNHLTDDIKNDGIRFTYSGTRIANDDRDAPYFSVENLQIFIKQDVFEKYKEYSKSNSKKTLFNEALNKFNATDIFSNNAFLQNRTKLLIRMEILDSNGATLYRKNINTRFENYADGVSYRNIFKFIDRINNENKKFSDVDISEDFYLFRNHNVNLSLKEMQSIASIKFSVIDHPNFGKR